MPNNNYRQLSRRESMKRRKKQQRRAASLTLLVSIVVVVLTLLIACGAESPEDVQPPQSSDTLGTSNTQQSTTPSTDASTETSPSETIAGGTSDTEPDISEPTIDTWRPSQEDIDAIAKTLWGECRGVPYISHQAAVAWCILNRVDSGRYGDTVLEVVSAPYQFSGYDPDYPVTVELAALAEDVLMRWHAEKEGQTDVGRVLPKDYCFFVGDGEFNYFTNEWRSKNYWDWSLPTPYES